jgi:RNA polymerase sigma factor (sigma-70 family)
MSVLPFTGTKLTAAFAQGEEGRPGHLAAEALVFFIRRELTKGGGHIAEALFGLLVERCLRAFRSMVRGVDEDGRDDIQAEVLADLTRLLLSGDDSGDFLQCRFWLYLRRRTVTARANWLRSKHSLLLSDDLIDEAGTGPAAENLVEDGDLSPEDRAILSNALARLPPDLRELVVLRHYEGWRVGDEPAERRQASDPSLAERYGITPRGVRKRLARAEALLKTERT